MNSPDVLAPPPLQPPVAPAKALRRIFLTVFLRGRSARGLSKGSAPKSVGQKLALTLLFYGLFGLFALYFFHQATFALSVYLHSMTTVFLGMFVAGSAGEMLFNKEEADILLHRPVTARALLWAKISVLVQISLWLAGSFNLVGFFVGLAARDSNWLFPLVHLLSTTAEALFCTGCVVLVYQLCLRWFGRERLEGLMTTAQVLIAVSVVLAGQILPRMIFRMEKVLTVGQGSWWIAFLPPSWFAGMDDALAGSGARASWVLAAIGLVAVSTVLWMAFGKLAGAYETGLQTLSEVAPSTPKQGARRRWINVLVNAPPLRWWLRDSVSRASFLLTAAYLFRDRDVKLRIYPGLAPMLGIPIVFLLQGGSSREFGIAFASLYIGIEPMIGLNLLQYSQQWQAADLFRTAPLRGPSLLCHGARRAVLLFLTLPLVILLGAFAWFIRTDASQMLLLLPGLIALPVFSLIPCLGGKAVPLSQPVEEARSAGRGFAIVGATFFSMALGGISYWSWSAGLFQWLLLAETLICAILYVVMRTIASRARWQSIE